MRNETPGEVRRHRAMFFNDRLKARFMKAMTALVLSKMNLDPPPPGGYRTILEFGPSSVVRHP